MASTIRDGFSGPVIGITGSAGKTTTKEFLAAALAESGPVLKTRGNRNTEYTVPLAWTELQPQHWAAVIEMSMRGFGQIRHLASFSRPNIGIVTNIGFSHMEMVGSRDGVARAKAELLEALPANGTAILWQADEYLHVLEKLCNCRTRTFGFSAGADCYITEYEPLSWGSCSVRGEIDGDAFEATLPSVGKHIALNAAAALLAAVTAGVPVARAAKGLEKAELPTMRMQIIEHAAATIVLDTYNASPASVLAALETMAALPVSGRRLAVLGEMRELGEYSEEAHRTVGAALVCAKVDEAVFIGGSTRFMLESAVAAGMSQDRLRQVSTHVEITEFLRSMQAGDVVLIKGSRALQLEKALEPLEVAVAY